MTLRRVRSFKTAKKQKITIPVKFLSFAVVPLLAALATTGDAHAYNLPAAMPSTQARNTLETKTARHSLVPQTASGFGAIEALPKIPKLLTKEEATKKPTKTTGDSTTDTNATLQQYAQATDMAAPLPNLVSATMPTAPAQPLPTAIPIASTDLPATTPTPALPAIPKKVDGSAYPYANAPWPNETSDPWGMYMRQCVSYTAWKVAASGRHMPNWGGSGNAKEWVSNAEAAGIPVDHTPRIGDVAIKMTGTYGHAMYVEAVNDDGTIDVSQYNAHYKGKYSTATYSTSGLYFIHF